VSSAANEPQRAAITIPELGAGHKPLLLVQWLVDLHTPVLSGDRVAEVLTAGVVFQTPAPAAGTLAVVEKGMRATVQEGEVIGWIECDGSSP
jgi:pyruvate/2-oxoglutarate dehydrogenase complex dihydrolipoamide acyltransferase (E2) component